MISGATWFGVIETSIESNCCIIASKSIQSYKSYTPVPNARYTASLYRRRTLSYRIERLFIGYIYEDEDKD